MRRFCLCFLVAVLAVQLIPPGFAQQASLATVPNLIRYGGALKNAEGAPLASTTVGVTFAIYGQQEGGAAVWMETQNVTTDASGNYSVLLGATTAAGLPGEMFSPQEQRWLGVQVQGEPEQPRVLMVSVPYAFKAHEADTLGGRSVSDFVLANGASSTSNGASTGQATSAPGSTNLVATSGGSNNASSAGPTNFSGSTTDQIVGVTQSGTGVAIKATADSKAIVGTATDPTNTAYGVQGLATGTAGVGLIGTASSPTGFTYGLRGTSSSRSGTGVRGINNATSGSTIGVSGYVASATGTAGVFNNEAGGNILIGQNNGATRFSVDGVGDVTGSGNITGNQLVSTVATGTAPLQVASTTQVTNLNASLLGGLGVGGFIQNGTTQQSGASLNIGGTATAADGVAGGNSSVGGTAVYGDATAMTGSGIGVQGISAGSSGIGVYGSAPFYGVYGTTAASGGVAVFGNATAATGASHGVAGYSASNAGVGVFGNATAGGGTTYGVYGTNASTGGEGVFGIATAGSGTTSGVTGVSNSTTGYGVYGDAAAMTGITYGVYGATASTGSSNGVPPSASGVYGLANTGNAYGVFGQSLSPTGVGVYGWASSTTGNDSGIVGETDSTTQYASGVFGVAKAATGQTFGTVGSTNSSTLGTSGVLGNATASTGATYGVYGFTNSNDPGARGVIGSAPSTTGSAVGVYGITAAPNGSGVSGYATSTASGFSVGVLGESANGDALHGISTAVNGSGVAGFSNSNGSGNTNGVAGINTATSGNANGVYGSTASPAAAAGFFDNSAGGYILFGRVNGGPDLFHVDGKGGGHFAGNVQVDGNLNVSGTLSKGGGSFKIDDPLDPANKTLSHSFVESPDMMNIYNGIVHLDTHGEAWITLPQYFEALNRDFRYQLTSVGAPQPRLYIAREVKGNRFKIAGGKANAKVSWQVTGIRQDAWANAHRIPNEEDKPVEQRGTYLHPELFGAADKQTDASLRH